MATMTILSDAEAYTMVEQITGVGGRAAEPVDTTMVERFVGQAEGVTPEQRAKVIGSMRSMIEQRRLARNPLTGGNVSLETMAATVAALEAM